MQEWKASASATLIGSMPHGNRQKVIDLIIGEISEIPVWPQIAASRAEQMMVQYSEGLPGYETSEGRNILHTDTPEFERELLSFYEEYLEVEAGARDIDASRFKMGEETGRTFRAFLERMREGAPHCRAVKGQIVGPFTLLTGMTDQRERALVYDERLRDVVVKHLAYKAMWQISQLKSLGFPVICFMDEPALAGFGSSAFISISAELVHGILNEVADAIHAAGAMAGVHVCANTDWNLTFDSAIDIINFDAYNYFEIFSMYKDAIARFIGRGGVIAWGIVPTGDPAAIQRETAESLADRWEEYARKITSPELPFEVVVSHSLFTPSCGCGTLSEADAERVVVLTRRVSEIVKKSV